MATLNRQDVVDRLAARLNLPKAAVNRVLDELGEMLAEELSRGNRVRISSLATFTVRETSPRRGHDPNTGKPIMIPLKRRVHTAVAKMIKDRVAGGVYGMAVLVSEGEPGVADDIRKGLESIGYSLGTGTTVEAALQAASTRPERVDLVVVGPFVSDAGYDELSRRLKVQKRTGGLPIARAMASTAAIDTPDTFRILPDAVFEEASELVEVVASEQERWREEKHYFVRQLRLRSPSDPATVAKLGEFIERLSDGVLPDEKQAYRLASSFKEAVENAAVHGNGAAADKFLEVHFYEDRNKITFEVTDQGGGFDYSKFLAATKEAKVDEIIRERARGAKGLSLGIKLMAVCADEIEFSEGGRRVRLTKQKP